MRLSRGDKSRRYIGGKFRIAALPLIAIFANLSLPTQAALPEIGTIRMLPRVAEDAKIGRWWSVSRAPWAGAGADEANPDSAVERAFAAVAPSRLAGHAPMDTGPARDRTADAAAIAYTPFEAKKVVWSPVPFYAVPPVGKGDYAWMRKPLPASIFSAEEQTCLATAIYFEARGESRKGQAAVAQVILNRVRNPAFPNTACGVVYQNASQRNRCQFSFACDGVKDRIRARNAWNRARKIAMEVTEGAMFVPEVGSATHYFASYVRPYWANSMIKMASIGTHQFFRARGGGWK
ncbi:MAG: hypothetical protein Kow0026_20410 [Oricola sp.]